MSYSFDNKNNVLSSTAAVPIALVLSLLSIVFLLRLLGLANHGLDFTDEGYYLNIISNPQAFKSEVSQFGHIYHLIYWLFDGDLAQIRQANLLGTFILSFILAVLTLDRFHPSIERHANIFRYAISGSISIASLAIFRLWLPTPNYNTLAFQALVIAAIGLLLASGNLKLKRFFGWQIIGLSVWLSLMAKPTTAIALVFILTLFFIRKPMLHFVHALAGALTSLSVTALFSVFSHGSVSRFVSALFDGLQFAQTIGASSSDGIRSYSFGSLFRLDILSVSGKAWGFLLVASSIILIAIRLRNLLPKQSMLVVIALQILSSAWLIIVFRPPPIKGIEFAALQFWIIPAAVILLLLLARRAENASWFPDNWLIPISFSLLPFAYTFGTMSNYWVGASSAGFFWILASIIALKKHPRNQIIICALTAAAQLLSLSVVLSAIERPYRQVLPIRIHDQATSLANGSILLLDSSASTYLNHLRDAASSNGFRVGDSMIDLTGQSPGTLFALGATPLGRAWLLGGYGGSTAAAIRSLQKTDCANLATSWILSQPGGSRSLPFSLLETSGIAVATDYAVVTVLQPGFGVDASDKPQMLMRPTRLPSDAEAACFAARTKLQQ